MPLSSVFLLLLITNCALGQYLVATLYNSSTCSGSSMGFLAYPTTCTAQPAMLGSGFQMASCSSRNYTIKHCSASTCISSTCYSTVSNSLTCSPYPSYFGQYATVSCGGLPNFKGMAVAAVLANSSCSSAAIVYSGLVTGVCRAIYPGSINSIITCNSTYITSSFCYDSKCKNCNNTYYPIGCNGTNYFSYTCNSTESNSNTPINTLSVILASIFGSIAVLVVIVIVIFFYFRKRRANNNLTFVRTTTSSNPSGIQNIQSIPMNTLHNQNSNGLSSFIPSTLIGNPSTTSAPLNLNYTESSSLIRNDQLNIITEDPPAYDDYNNVNNSDTINKPPISTKMSKFCGNCGSTLIPGDKFCRDCGKPMY